MEVVLLNSNPATIMTDKDIADKVYIEPLTVEVVEQLILKEKPDSVLPTLGGQAGLNLAMELEEKGFLKEHNVRLIGTTAETIKKAEDRQEFKDTMEKIGEPCCSHLKVVTTCRRWCCICQERSVIRLFSVLLIHLAEAAAVSPHNEVELQRNPRKWSSSFPCRRGSGRTLHRRMERNRVRSNA